MSSPSRSLILSLILVATITSFLSFHLYGFKETFANGGPVNNSNFSTFASQNTNPTLGSTTTNLTLRSQLLNRQPDLPHSLHKILTQL